MAKVGDNIKEKIFINFDLLEYYHFKNEQLVAKGKIKPGKIIEVENLEVQVDYVGWAKNDEQNVFIKYVEK